MSQNDNRRDEIVTVYYCEACEMMSMAGDVDIHGHVDDRTGYQLACSRCKTPLNAENFHDYVDFDVAEYR